jgi:hypothetical protein
VHAAAIARDRESQRRSARGTFVSAVVDFVAVVQGRCADDTNAIADTPNVIALFGAHIRNLTLEIRVRTYARVRVTFDF